MAKEFFKNLPDTTTPLEASRLNGLLDGEEAMGNLVVDSIRSKNMLNKNSFENAYISNTGVVTTANNNALFDYIEVEPNTTYTMSVSQTINTMMIGEYNSSKTWLARPLQNNVSSLTITTSANTKYLRVAINKDSSSTMTQALVDGLQPQLEKGDTATNYAPYQKLDDEYIMSTINYTIRVIKVGKYVILNGEITASNDSGSITLPYQAKYKTGTAIVGYYPNNGNIQAYGYAIVDGSTLSYKASSAFSLAPISIIYIANE